MRGCGLGWVDPQGRTPCAAGLRGAVGRAAVLRGGPPRDGRLAGLGPGDRAWRGGSGWIPPWAVPRESGRDCRAWRRSPLVLDPYGCSDCGAVGGDGLFALNGRPGSAGPGQGAGGRSVAVRQLGSLTDRRPSPWRPPGGTASWEAKSPSWRFPRPSPPPLRQDSSVRHCPCSPSDGHLLHTTQQNRCQGSWRTLRDPC
jgi:hypothetical protein